MKKITLFTTLYLLLSTSFSFSQTDLYWKLGRNAALTFTSGVGTPNLYDTCKTELDDASTSITDNYGRTIFYTNGCTVLDRADNLMPNGSNFNHGTLSDSYCNSGGSPLIRGTVAVPFPNDTNKFYLFYENMEWSIPTDLFPDKLRYLIVDKSLHGGLGDVTQKDLPLISNDTLMPGNLIALKHGNGKDYWLLARKFRTNRFYVFLIDSAGVHRETDQLLGDAYLEPDMEMNICNSNRDNDKIAYSFLSLNTTPHWSPNQIDLYDFDRCTGKLLNYKKLVMDNVIDTLAGISVCFSPNSRYLYVNNVVNLWQMDLQNPNPVHNRILVGTKLQGETYVFWQTRNAPDGKIYMTSNNGCKYMMVINAPDSAGTTCNFVQKQIYFGTGFKYADGSLPNLPNMQLGALNCKVGGINDNLKNEKLVVYPNPANEWLIVNG